MTEIPFLFIALENGNTETLAVIASIQDALRSYDEGKIENALSILDAIEPKAPQLKIPGFEHFRCQCLRALGMQEAALLASLAELGTWPTHTQAQAAMNDILADMFNEAVEHAKNKNWEGVLHSIRLPYHFKLNSMGLYYLWAFAHYSLGNLAEAGAALEKELELNPHDTDARTLLTKLKEQN